MTSSLPTSLDHLVSQVASLSMTVGDITSAVSTDPATQAIVEAGDEASKNSGFFGSIAGIFEVVLKAIDSRLVDMNVPYSFGFAIIILTILVKIITLPLTKKQVESTFQMQKIQPKVKEIQNKYKGNQEKAQLEVARLYREAEVNPLAGCLPTLATIPVFIGLYRALSNVAEEGLLKEGFFWIPSLGGPTTLAIQKAGGGFSWLLPLTDGAPPIGWGAALAYLSLPVALVASQFISQKVISPPPSDDPSQQSTQWILKFLPLMIGYFSLNVPSGLALYWFTNNLLSTGQQVWLKSNMAAEGGGNIGGSGTATLMSESEKAEQDRLDRVRQLTGQDTGARRSKEQMDSTPAQTTSSSGNRGKRKGDKFRQLKAAEAERKAARSKSRSEDS